MKIKILKGTKTDRLVFAGDVIEIDDKTGKALIDKEFAEAIEKPVKADVKKETKK